MDDLQNLMDLTFDDALLTSNGLSTPSVILENVLQLKEENLKKSNPFPVEAFPLRIQEIIRATNQGLNYPIDFIGAAILAGLSQAIGGTVQLEVKNGWKERASLFIAIVGSPGTMKSPPLTYAMKPFYDMDKDSYIVYKREKEIYDQEIEKNKKDRQPDLVKPVWKKNIVTDFTPEALASLLQNNKRGISAVFDELAAWFKNFGRYSKGSDAEAWLSLWSQKNVSIDRKSGDPIFIERPIVNVLGGIQSGIIEQIGSDGRSLNGFTHRILFAFPDGLEKMPISDTQLDPEFANVWKQIVNKLFYFHTGLEDVDEVPTMKFSEPAFEVWRAWQLDLTNKANRSANESLQGIYSKIETYSVRFCLILQLAAWSCGDADRDEVSRTTVVNALLLTDYFRLMAEKVHRITTEQNAYDKLNSAMKKIYEALPDQFETKDGLAVAIQLDISARTFKNYLNDRKLFNKTGYGKYEKIL